MIVRIELSNGESFSKVVDVQEYINNVSTNVTANIVLGKYYEEVFPNIEDIYTKFSNSLDSIKIYSKDSESQDEYLSKTLSGYVSVRSVNKSYNYNSISIMLAKS